MDRVQTVSCYKYFGLHCSTSRVLNKYFRLCCSAFRVFISKHSIGQTPSKEHFNPNSDIFANPEDTEDGLVRQKNQHSS